MEREEYYQAHIAVCHSAKNKRQCARQHWNWCKKIGHAPVLHFHELPEDLQPDHYRERDASRKS